MGISFFNYLKIMRYKKKHFGEYNILFLNKKIKFSSPFWFLHSLEEIYIDQIYKFDPSNEPKNIIDCGANIGLSVIYLKKLFPNSNITAFEPDKKIFSHLEHNIDNFNFSNVNLFNSAVWINNNKINFHSEGSVGGRISDNQEKRDNEIGTIRLRDFILKERIFFLKIDIEGAEYEVLKDCKEYLSNIDNLFIEYHKRINDSETLHEILTWIIDAGFTIYIKEAWNNMSVPFTKKIDGYYQIQLNIFCFRK